MDTVVLQGLFTASSVHVSLRWNAGPEFSQEPVISPGLMHQSTVSRQSRNLTEGMCLMKNMGALMPRKDRQRQCCCPISETMIINPASQNPKHSEVHHSRTTGLFNLTWKRQISLILSLVLCSELMRSTIKSRDLYKNTNFLHIKFLQDQMIWAASYSFYSSIKHVHFTALYSDCTTT